jgi:hypothetical protein
MDNFLAEPFHTQSDSLEAGPLSRAASAAKPSRRDTERSGVPLSRVAGGGILALPETVQREWSGWGDLSGKRSWKDKQPHSALPEGKTFI